MTDQGSKIRLITATSSPTQHNNSRPVAMVSSEVHTRFDALDERLGRIVHMVQGLLWMVFITGLGVLTLILRALFANAPLP